MGRCNCRLRTATAESDGQMTEDQEFYIHSSHFLLHYEIVNRGTSKKSYRAGVTRATLKTW